MTADSAACDTGQVTQDSYYSPERVKALLRLYPYLADSKPPTDPELAGLSRKVFGPGGWREEAAVKRADISSALDWLTQRDWRAAYCVRSVYCVGLPLRAVASYLERAGADALAQISAISGDVRIHRARLENGQIVPGVMVASINLANEAIEWYVRSGDASASE